MAAAAGLAVGGELDVPAGDDAGGQVAALAGVSLAVREGEVFSVIGRVVNADCATRWWHVQLPIRRGESLGIES